MDLAEAQVDSYSAATSHANSMRSPSVGRLAIASEPRRSPALITTVLTLPKTRTLNSTVVQLRADPWATIVSNLSECTGCETAGRRLGPTAARPYYVGKEDRQAASINDEDGQSSVTKNVHVSFVERSGAKTVSLTWHDSTEACYGEQAWMLKIARSSGHCALTGMAVKRGDTIYSPASRAATRPLNCTQMILAAALERLEVRIPESWPNDLS